MVVVQLLWSQGFWQHQVLRGVGGLGRREYSALEGDEEIPHVQGKRNPSKMVGVARGHQRADTLKP